MESLSRPLHRRKLSNASSFSGRNAYDGVFSGHRRKYAGVPAANVEDYREIFNGAQAASSIPVLDLSTLEESSDGSNSELGSSKPDYCKIFGGFRDEDIAVSYEELFARDKARARSSTSPSSQDLDDSSRQPVNALKQFNMSYHKISQRNKDGLDGTTHVTQLHAVPRFTRFIDEAGPPQKKETEKQKSSIVNNVHPSVDPSQRVFLEKQTSGSAVKSRSNNHQDESLSDDRISKRFEVDLESNPSKASSSPSASATNVDNHKDYLKRSTAREFSPTYFDEELDVNSAAAASAAALKKAIEKAQESIRIAKESVGRKKEGLRSFSSKSFKDSLKVKTRPENVSEGGEQKGKDNKMERVGAASQMLSNVGRDYKYGGTAVFTDFADGEKLFGAKKVIDEIHGKISESAKKAEVPTRFSSEFRDSKEVVRETEAIGLVSVGKCEDATRSSKAVENNAHDARQEDKPYAQKPNGFLALESHEKKLGETAIIKDDKPRESKENKDEVRLSNALKLVEGSDNLTVYIDVEDEKKTSQESNQSDYKKRLNDALGLLENVKQEILEQEEVDEVENAEMHEADSDDEASGKRFENETELKEDENSENHKEEEEEGIEKVENAGRHEPNSDDEASEKGLENEKELKEDGNTDCHKEEYNIEKFYDVCELEMSENGQTCSDSLGNGEDSPKEGCEMKGKESHEGEEMWKRSNAFHEQETYENSSSDYDDAEESECASNSHYASTIVTDAHGACKVGLNENHVESSQDVDDVISSTQVKGASDEFQVDTGKAIEADYRSEEKEIFEKISVHQTADEDNEDEWEAKADNLSNSGLGESSSDTTSGLEIEVNECKERKEISEEETIVDLQTSHEERPKIRSENGMGASEEPKVSNVMEGTMDVNEEIITSHYGEKKDEIRETGPTKVVAKEHHKRTEEVTAGERERERNRLAVERAIREARERAFAEARERAGRAAVERANAEVRERVMADAREGVAKASVGTKPSDTTSAQSKLRAERAAVERATLEARQRALEKAMSLKNICDTRAQANEIRQSSSSDLHSSNGTSAESAQRSKVKLEKHNRIMERAAKALAEKEKRDLLARKEQAERSRLAENLDAEIKRWSSGKEGNLRALLSTLQYILGPDSGWQPVSLTEIITTTAVKKAYRKATLCVHPDKLQQRGASIQQKYICEKVFDLLKAAWTRFISEER